jgi:hypothetical protein
VIEQVWPAWRLVLEQVATLGELDGPQATYSLTDVFHANALLDMKADINAPKETPA